MTISYLRNKVGVALTAAMIAMGAFAGPATADELETCLGRTTLIDRIGACSRAIEGGIEGRKLADAYTARGVSYAKLGQMDNAVVDLSEALKLEKSDANIWVARARAFYSKKDHDRAMLDLAEAIKLDPDNAVPHNLMGKNHYMLGNYDIAIEFFDKAIELDSNHYNSFVNRATTLYRMNKLPEAIRDVNAAYLMLPPGDSRARALVQLKRAIERAYASQQASGTTTN